jgi:hypothetical protein
MISAPVAYVVAFSRLCYYANYMFLHAVCWIPNVANVDLIIFVYSLD